MNLSWLPRSEWCSSPGQGFRLVMAMFSAARVNSCGMVSLIAQPTTLRENRSMMAAKYSQPSPVAI